MTSRAEILDAWDQVVAAREAHAEPEAIEALEEIHEGLQEQWEQENSDTDQQ